MTRMSDTRPSSDRSGSPPAAKTSVFHFGYLPLSDGSGWPRWQPIRFAPAGAGNPADFLKMPPGKMSQLQWFPLRYGTVLL